MRTMECRTCSESITAFVDGELDAKERAEIEGHLSQCESCRGEHKSLRYAQDLIDRIPVLDLSPKLWPKIDSGLTALKAPQSIHPAKSQSLLKYRWLPVAATLLLGVLTSFFLLYHANPSSLRLELDAYVKERDQLKTERRIPLSEPSQPAHHNPFAVHDHILVRNPFVAE